MQTERGTELQPHKLATEVKGGSAKGKAPIPVFLLPVRPLLSMRILLLVLHVLTVRPLLPVLLQQLQ